MFPSSPKLLRIILRSISTDVSSLSLNTLLSLAQALKYGRDIKALFDKYVTYEFTIKHVMEILKFNHCFESMQQIGILVFLELHFSQCKLERDEKKTDSNASQAAAAAGRLLHAAGKVMRPRD